MNHASQKEALSLLGLTHKDRAMLRAMAIRVRETGRGFEPYPLDAPYLAAAVPHAKRRFWTGQMIGRLEGCAILVWPKEADLFDAVETQTHIEMR